MIQQLPLTVRRSIELLGIVMVALIVSQLQNILMPMLMAIVASIALLPIYRFLVRKKVPNTISIFITLLIMTLILTTIVLFVTSQLKPLVLNFSSIKSNSINHINEVRNWFSYKTGISSVQQNNMIEQQTNNFIDSAGSFLNNAMGSVSVLLIFFGLFPIYTFLILYYKSNLKKFLLLWFPKNENAEVEATLKSIESIIQSYITGLLIQFTYMTILLGGTLLLFGIQHALLIAVIFALLNLIPYIGALIGNIIGVLLTLSSSPDLGSVFTVLIIISIVQFLDNNILMPYIVGAKIRINALVSLFGVFVGGALAGIGGMFLSLPIMAVIKIICDHTEQFKKWGALLGDDKPLSSKFIKPRKAN